MKRLLAVLAVLALIAAGFYGCTKENATNPWGGGGDGDGAGGCLACHGDEDMLKGLLPEEEGREVYTRGDG